MPIVSKLRRKCRHCGVMFVPSGKFCRHCGDCKLALQNEFRYATLGKKIKRLEK